MKTAFLTIFVLILAAANSTLAQVSPEVLPDGRVTFRIKAPMATTVLVTGHFTRKLELKKTDDELWEGTTAEWVPPGIHEYSFRVDGMRIIDPRNGQIRPKRWPYASMLHIPADPPAYWDIRDVPHGILHLRDYYSTVLKSWRKMRVYTPPGMESMDGPLPVLYLSAGYTDSEETWTKLGKTHWIMDAMIHEKKVTPMIIVMPDAHSADPEGKTFAEYAPGNTFVYAEELLTDIIPFAEANYPVDTRPSGRAYAGVSMGGQHAFTVAFQHHSLFSAIAAFSAVAPDVAYMKEHAQVDEMNRDLDLFWIACGDKDFLFERNQTAHPFMESIGINHEYMITQGDRHTWPVFRRYLVQFLPRLFQ